MYRSIRSQLCQRLCKYQRIHLNFMLRSWMNIFQYFATQTDTLIDQIDFDDRDSIQSWMHRAWIISYKSSDIHLDISSKAYSFVTILLLSFYSRKNVKWGIAHAYSWYHIPSFKKKLSISFLVRKIRDAPFLLFDLSMRKLSMEFSSVPLSFSQS